MRDVNIFRVLPPHFYGLAYVIFFALIIEKFNSLSIFHVTSLLNCYNKMFYTIVLFITLISSQNILDNIF